MEDEGDRGSKNGLVRVLQVEQRVEGVGKSQGGAGGTVIKG